MAQVAAQKAAAVTPGSFAVSLLKGMGDPTTPQNVSSLVGWEAREGGNWNNTAKDNPLNTTQAEPGYTKTGTQGDIGSYNSWQQGLEATEQTLKNGDYSDIDAALKSGQGLTGDLPGLAKWSGGGYSSVPASGTASTAGAMVSPNTAATSPVASAAGNDGLNMKAASAAAFLHAAESNASGGSGQDPLTDLVSNIQSGNYGGNGKLPQVARAQSEIGTTSKPANSTEYNDVVSAATAIANHEYNYEWGGGHNATAAPTHGTGHGSGSGIGYDCSGALSSVLMSVGVLKAPLVAAQFSDASKYIAGAQPGVGGNQSITIYANATHTFSKIGNQYFGTSFQNPGGGADFFKSAQTAGYQVWHINL